MKTLYEELMQLEREIRRAEMYVQLRETGDYLHFLRVVEDESKVTRQYDKWYSR